uniref:Uncharacterized protein n=1 Tax=Rhizophora mucronata TaxID=61149 RepID=A0A2P2QC06_RHIMU
MLGLVVRVGCMVFIWQY